MPLADGSRVVVLDDGRLLELETGRWPEFTPGHGPTLTLGTKALGLPGYETVRDLAVAGDRVVALVEGDGPTKSLTLTNLALTEPRHWDLARDVARAVVTRSCVFAASPAEVFSVDDKRTIATAPHDLAATSDRLAVIDEQGITFFDADGNRESSTPLYLATALAVDRVEPGWLVAIDGGIFHLDGPEAAPRRIAHVAERASKVRRTKDTVYVKIGNVVKAIAGDRVRDVSELDGNAWYWTDFDASADRFTSGGKELSPRA